MEGMGGDEVKHGYGGYPLFQLTRAPATSSIRSCRSRRWRRQVDPSTYLGWGINEDINKCIMNFNLIQGHNLSTSYIIIRSR